VSQAKGAAIHSKLPGSCQHEIVGGFLKKWKRCGAVQAGYGCLVSQRVHGRPSVPQFLPHNSATLQFQILKSMQMDAEFEKEQIGTLFCLVGALEGRGV